jgi:hypothetical protein
MKFFFNFVFFLLTIVFLACSALKSESIERETYIKLIDTVSESIKGLSFKSLEAKGAVEIFEEYKILKLKVIQNKLLYQLDCLEVENLEEVRRLFNNMTMDADMLYYIENGTRENPYIKEFESAFVEQLIKISEPDRNLNISDLKIVYEY